MTTSLAEFKQTAIANALRSCQLFAGMSPVELAAIAEFTVVKNVPKAGYLFREGDPSTGFYVVQTGAINVHRVNAVGKEQIIHVFRAGESFAEGTLATDKGYPADARAVETSQVLLVQKSGMLALLRRQPELALRMLGSMSGHLRILVAQLEDLTLKDVETRLANWLLKRCPSPDSSSTAVSGCSVIPPSVAACIFLRQVSREDSVKRFRIRLEERPKGPYDGPPER